MVNIRYACITVHVDNVAWKPPYAWPNWITYCEGQLELSYTNHSQHWQIYAEATLGYSVTQWKAVFGKHCHVETRRGTREQALEYVRKEETRVHGPDTMFLYGELRPTNDISCDRKKLTNAYKNALTMPTYQEALDYLKAEVPRDYVLHYTNMTNTLKTVYTTKYTPRTDVAWKVDKLPEDVLQRKPVFITGSAGTGKTTWALWHFKNPILVSHIDDLKRFDARTNDGLVFDDMTFTHWPPTSCIHIVDMEHDRTINVRYGTVTIPAWTKRIFTTNIRLTDYFSPNCTDEQWDAIYRRLYLYNVTEQLF